MKIAMGFALGAAVILLPGCGGKVSAEPAAVAPVFATPQAVTLLGYTGEAMEPFISPDGQVLLFNSSNNPAVDTDLQWATRVSDLVWQYQGPVQGANSTALDGVPSLDGQGACYFITVRSYAQDLCTVYRGLWQAGTVTGVARLAGLPATMAGRVIFDAAVSRDGQTLYFAEGDYRSGALTTAELGLATGGGAGFARHPDGARLLASVNLAGGTQYAPCIADSGLELFFTRLTGASAAIHVAVRRSPAEPFGAPTRLTALDGFVEAPALDPTQGKLYFHKRVEGVCRIWMAVRVP